MKHSQRTPDASDGAPSCSETDVSLLEGMATARTIRRYTRDEIPDEHLSKILWSATRAPSGTNRQPFRFLVLRDGSRARQAKTLMAEAFRRGWQEKSTNEGWTEGDFDRSSRRGRTLAAMQQFVDDFEHIPVIVLALFERYRPLSHHEGASVFPACQNLFLAARALGYGACFSGWHLRVEQELRDLLEIPENVELSLCITLGKPAGNHGPLRRRPIGDLVFDDVWQGEAKWAKDPPGSRFTRGGPPKASR